MKKALLILLATLLLFSMGCQKANPESQNPASTPTKEGTVVQSNPALFWFSTYQNAKDQRFGELYSRFEGKEEEADYHMLQKVQRPLLDADNLMSDFVYCLFFAEAEGSNHWKWDSEGYAGEMNLTQGKLSFKVEQPSTEYVLCYEGTIQEDGSAGEGRIIRRDNASGKEIQIFWMQFQKEGEGYRAQYYFSSGSETFTLFRYTFQGNSLQYGAIADHYQKPASLETLTLDDYLKDAVYIIKQEGDAVELLDLTPDAVDQPEEQPIVNPIL